MPKAKSKSQERREEVMRKPLGPVEIIKGVNEYLKDSTGHNDSNIPFDADIVGISVHYRHGQNGNKHGTITFKK